MTWSPVVLRQDAPVPNESASATTLYRMFAANDRLLYVGISARAVERWRPHGHDKKWWREVSGVTVQHFATREQALAAELVAIRTEAPKHNATDHPSATSQAGATKGITLVVARRAYRKLAAKGRVTGTALGAALGVSDVMGRTWKRRVEGERGVPTAGKGVAA